MQTRGSPEGISGKNSDALVGALPWQRCNQSRLNQPTSISVGSLAYTPKVREQEEWGHPQTYVCGETEAYGRQKAVVRARAVSTNCPLALPCSPPPNDGLCCGSDLQLGLVSSQRQYRNLVLPMKRRARFAPFSTFFSFFGARSEQTALHLVFLDTRVHPPCRATTMPSFSSKPLLCVCTCVWFLN